MSESHLTVTARVPSTLQAAVDEQLAAAADARVGERLRAGDPTLWAPTGTPEVANRLGWLTIAERMLDELGPLELFAAEARDGGLRDVVLLGMGGSSLAPEVLRRAFETADEQPRLHVLDSTDAQTVRAVTDAVDIENTLFVVSSKSGGTIEPLSLFAHFFSLRPDGKDFIAITDPGTGLQELAGERGFRHVFAGDPDIGGRYSALSAFGIVPARLMGIDVHSLLAGASAAWDTHVSTPAGAEPAGIWLGAALSALAKQGRDKLTFLTPGSLPGLGLWLEQLVAESTGKHGTGILPVAEEPIGEPAAYGEDRVFAHLPDVGSPDADPGLAASAQALAEAGHPLVTVPTSGPEDLGRLFLLFEIAVAAAGWGLQINPFDQPNVQQAKDATNEVLERYEADKELPEPPDADDAAVRRLLLGCGPPEYVAIMAYTEPTPAFDAAISELRSAIRDRTKATTTFGYGPRFLHSTGQFHKGGPKTGRFLQLVHDGEPDVDIPGRPFSFTTLKNAQAVGDLNTLRELGLPAERLRLKGEEPVSALRSLTAQIKEQA